MVRKQALFTNFCVAWLNFPPCPRTIRVKEKIQEKEKKDEFLSPSSRLLQLYIYNHKVGADHFQFYHTF